MSFPISPGLAIGHGRLVYPSYAPRRLAFMSISAEVASLRNSLITVCWDVSGPVFMKGQGSYGESLGVDAVLNHGDADGEGAAVELAVLLQASVRRVSWRETERSQRTRMVEISCKISTACWAAACFSWRSSAAGGMLAHPCW
jgi:hypothetical protein